MIDHPSMTVLVVSSQLGDVALIKSALGRAGSFGVYIAGTAQKALVMLGRVDFTAILIDAELPDSPGLVLLRQVAQRGYAGPVIFVASNLEKGLAAEALAAGAFEVLPKFEHFSGAIPKLVLRGIERARLLQRIWDLEVEVCRLQARLATDATAPAGPVVPFERSSTRRRS